MKAPTLTPRAALLVRIAVMLALYFGLSEYGGQVGRKILWPIRIFVTYLHEFGHAVGALITGGKVLSVTIDPHGGGVTWTANGSRPIIIMGGYIGSAVFGNLLFYIGAKWPRLVKPALGILMATMVVTGLVWFKTVFTSAVLFGFAGVLFVIGFKTKFGREVLMFLGLASVIYIIQDTASGPSSDLRAFEAELSFLPAQVWMVIWLLLALGILALNARMLWGEDAKDEGEVKPKPKPEKKIKAVK